MAQRFDRLDDRLSDFIRAQKLFFVGTATDDGRINVSPKGCDTLRLVDDNRLLWMNLTGSGNETAAHLQQSNRLTMMFCSFDEKPLILRLYGVAQIIHPRDSEWRQYIEQFPDFPNARQLIDFSFDLVQTSCGFGVPFYDYIGERDNMDKWVAAKGADAIRAYWAQKNQISLDGLPTHILDDE